ncbi:MAG: LysR family transcriptional regulator, partial [Pararhodobacter sp.]|nr:LysR family transcriptional regulator [Pararhodobacter sp.]
RPEEPDLVARLIREGQANLYAAPAFIRRHGRPRTLADLRDLPFIGMAEPARMAVEFQRLGLPVTARNLRQNSDNTV